MIEVTRSELLPGVHLTAVHTKKFKSSVLGLQFLLPLQEETASLNALVPMVLRRGTREHPDLEALSAALDELYGGSLEPMVRKKGETQCVGFLGSFLDDAYTLDGAPLLERAAALLGEVVFHPYTSAGAFCPDYTSQEKTNLIDRIRTGVVVDYLNCLFINFPVFNFADVCICVGVGLLVLSLLLDMRREQKVKQQKGSAPTDGTA